MRAETQRDFYNRIAELEDEERMARLRWLTATVRMMKNVAKAEGDPLEIHLIPLSTLVALLECNRNQIPLEYWRPDFP